MNVDPGVGLTCNGNENIGLIPRLLVIDTTFRRAPYQMGIVVPGSAAQESESRERACPHNRHGAYRWLRL